MKQTVMRRTYPDSLASGKPGITGRYKAEYYLQKMEWSSGMGLKPPDIKLV